MVKRGTALRVSRDALSRFGAFYRSYLFPAIIIGATMFYIAYYLRANMAIKEYATEWQRAYKIILCIHGLALFNKVLERQPLELRILLLNVVWLFLARCITGKYTFTLDDECWWAVMLLVLFASGYFLDKKRRELLLTCITLELVVVTAVWAVVAIVTAINRESVAGFELIRVWVRLLIPIDEYIEIYTYRTIISAYYFICVGLILYKCFFVKTVWWRVLAAVYFPLSFMGIALQDCRVISVCYCLLIGMPIVARIFKSAFLGKMRRQRVVFAGCWLVCVGLLFVSLGFCARVILDYAGTPLVIPTPAASSTPAPKSTEGSPTSVVASRAVSATNVVARLVGSTATASASVKAVQGSQGEQSHVRGSWWDISRLSGRTQVWRATIPTLLDNKRMAIFGQSEKKAMKAINAHVVHDTEKKVTFGHMHNVLLQQLVVAGIPGFLLFVALLIVIIRRVASAFRSFNCVEVSETQVLGLLLALLILYGMTEPLLCHRLAIANVFFCVGAGVLVAKASEKESVQNSDTGLSC